MEIYLNTEKDIIRLPVLPASFERTLSTNLSETKIIGLGDVAAFDGDGLSRITLESFFPNRDYSFNAYSPVPPPYEFILKLGIARQHGKPVRLIITGTGINKLMLITNLNYGERDCTGDVYYTIDLVEYRSITIPKLSSNNDSGNTNSNSNSNNNTNRPSENKPTTNTQKSYKVKKGDCLWDIAQKHYGKGSQYTKIKNANTTKYPNLKKNNVIHVGWELIIP